MRIPVIAGRDFDERDRLCGERVVIVMRPSSNASLLSAISSVRESPQSPKGLLSSA
jgi:hypothetical protein